MCLGISTHPPSNKKPRVTGAWCCEKGIYLIKISSLLFYHTIINTRWIRGIELVVFNIVDTIKLLSGTNYWSNACLAKIWEYTHKQFI